MKKNSIVILLILLCVICWVIPNISIIIIARSYNSKAIPVYSENLLPTTSPGISVNYNDAMSFNSPWGESNGIHHDMKFNTINFSFDAVEVNFIFNNTLFFEKYIEDYSIKVREDNIHKNYNLRRKIILTEPHDIKVWKYPLTNMQSLKLLDLKSFTCYDASEIKFLDHVNQRYIMYKLENNVWVEVFSETGKNFLIRLGGQLLEDDILNFLGSLQVNLDIISD